MYGIVYVHDDGRLEYCTVMKTAQFSDKEEDILIIKYDTAAREAIAKMYRNDICAIKGPGKLAIVQIMQIFSNIEQVEPEIKKDYFVISGLTSERKRIYYCGTKSSPRISKITEDQNKATAFNTYSQATFALSHMKRFAYKKLNYCIHDKNCKKYIIEQVEKDVLFVEDLKVIHIEKVKYAYS